MTDSDATRDPRLVAADWHGGQGSALYAFASTGAMTDGLEREVRECIALTNVHRSHYVDVDRRELDALLAYVQRAGWIAQSRWLGADAALAATTWLEMDAADAVSILSDVDPAVVDRYPEPNLSGESADDPTPDSLAVDVGLTRDQLTICPEGPEIVDAIAEAWEEGRDLVWADAVQAVALRTLGHVDRALTVEGLNERRVARLRDVSESDDPCPACQLYACVCELRSIVAALEGESGPSRARTRDHAIPEGDSDDA